MYENRNKSVKLTKNLKLYNSIWSLVREFFEHVIIISSVYKIRQKTNVYDYLLISLLLYDKVSAFLLLVKVRNSSFLIGQFVFPEMFTFAAPRVMPEDLHFAR